MAADPNGAPPGPGHAKELASQAIAEHLGVDPGVTRTMWPDLMVSPGEIVFSGAVGPEDRMTEALPSQQGPLGVADVVGKMDAMDWLALTPFSTAGLVKAADLYGAVQRLKSGDYEALAEQKSRLVPTATTTFGQVPVYGATPEQATAEQLKARDQDLVSRWLIEQQELDRRGMTMWAQAAKGLMVLPSWMAEFAMTGGLATLGKTAAKDAVVALLRKQAQTRAGALALRAAGWMGEGITRATLGMPHRTSEEILDRRLAGEVSLDDDGKIKLQISPDSWATDILKGWSETVISAATESAGGAIGEGMGAVTSAFGRTVEKLPFGKPLLARVERAWLGLHAGLGHSDFVEQIFKQSGWDGLLEEIGEERLQTILEAVTNTRDFGAGRDSDLVDRMVEGVKQDIQGLPAEVLVLSVPGAVRFAGNQVGAAISKGRANEAQAATAKEQPPGIQTQGVGNGQGQGSGPAAEPGAEAAPGAAEAQPLEGPITPEVLQQIFDEMEARTKAGQGPATAIPDWQQQMMAEEGLTPGRFANVYDASRPDFQEIVRKDPLFGLMQQRHPELADRYVKGDLTPDEYKQVMQEAKASSGPLSAENMRKQIASVVAETPGIDEAPDRYADTVVSLLGARAAAMGMTTDDLVAVRVAGVRRSKAGEVVQEGLLGTQDASQTGAVQLLEDGRAIIHVFETADASTVVHQLGHLFTLDLPSGDFQTVSDWLGAQGDAEWTGEQQEQWARAFERYARDGKAPTPALRRIFWRFRDWLRRVYKAIQGSPVDIKIPAVIRDVMDRMFTGGKPTIDVKTSGRPVRPRPSELVNTRRAIAEHPVYQDALANIQGRLQLLQGAPWYVDPRGWGDLQVAIEQQPEKVQQRLRGMFTQDKAGHTAWDVVAMEAGMEANDPQAFAEELGQWLQASSGKGQVLEGAVDLARSTHDRGFELLVAKYEMLKAGMSVQEINKALVDSVTAQGGEPADMPDLFVQDSGTPYYNAGPTPAERQAIRRQIQKTAKARGIEMSDADLDRAIDQAFSKAQERGLPVGYEMGRLADRAQIDKLREKISDQRNEMLDRLADERAAGVARADQARRTARQRDQARKDHAAELVSWAKKNLPLRERGKLLDAVKNMTGDAALSRALSMAEALADDANRRSLREKIAAELTTTGVRNQAGRPVGTLTADIHARLGEIQTDLEMYAKQPREEVLRQIADAIEQFDNGAITLDALRDVTDKAHWRGLNSMSEDELQTVLEDIQTLKLTGHLAHEEKRLAEAARLAEDKSKILRVLTGGQELKAGTDAIPREQLDRNLPGVHRWVLTQAGWRSLLDRLSRLEKGKGPNVVYQSDLSNFGRMAPKASAAEKIGRDAMIKELTEGAKVVFGETFEEDLARLKDEVAITGVDLWGQQVTIECTRDALIKKYQEMLDPSLDASIRGGERQDGSHFGMGWTDQIMDAVRTELTAKERAWALWLIKFYNRYYEGINQVYRDRYNVNLPHNQWYSPIYRDVESQEIPDDLLAAQELLRWASPTNRSLKSRVGSVKPLAFTGATQAVVSHVAMMEHFKAWALPMQLFRQVFRDRMVAQAIRQFHSPGDLAEVHSLLAIFGRGGVERAKQVAWLDRVRSRFVAAALGGRPSVSLLQPISWLSYATDPRLGLKDLFLGSIDFWRKPIDHLNELKAASPILKARWEEGFERDIKDMLATKGIDQVRHSTRWLGFLCSWPSRKMDQFNTSMAAWAAYKAEMARSGDKEKAIDLATEITQETQSSSDPTSMSSFQQDSSWHKLLTMFQNEQNKQWRYFADGYRNLVAGRGDPVKNLINMVMAAAVMPTLVMFVRGAFTWRKKEQAQTLAMGPFQNLFILGQIEQSLVHAAWREDGPTTYLSPLESALVEGPTRAVTKTSKVVGDWLDPDEYVSADEFAQMLEAMAVSAGHATGLPLPYAAQAERAIRQGKYEELVWSRSALGADKKPKTITGK